MIHKYVKPLIVVFLLILASVSAYSVARVHDSIQRRAGVINIAFPIEACSAPVKNFARRFDLGLPHGPYTVSVFVPFVPEGQNSHEDGVCRATVEITLDGKSLMRESKVLDLTRDSLTEVYNQQNIDAPAEPRTSWGWPRLSYPWDAIASLPRKGLLLELTPRFWIRELRSDVVIDVSLDSGSADMSEWLLRVDNDYEM